MEDILTPRNVSRRQQHQQKLRQSQQSQMDSKRVEKDRRDFHQPVSASNDLYMKNALAKVRRSDVTHNETVTRLSGTWLYNQTLKN